MSISHSPAVLTPPPSKKEHRYPFNWRLGGPQRRSGCVWRLEKLLRPEFELRPFHLKVYSLYRLHCGKGVPARGRILLPLATCFDIAAYCRIQRHIPEDQVKTSGTAETCNTHGQEMTCAHIFQYISNKMQCYTVYFIWYPTSCKVTQFILSGNCSTCFGWYLHSSTGAHTTVFTASGICQTVTATCHYRGGVGTTPPR